MTVCVLSARPPSNNGLLFMSFGMILVAYCLAPLPLCRQAILMLSYSAAVLFVSRQSDGATLLTAGATHAMAHLFGAVTSWRLNHRRREMFLGALRETAADREGEHSALVFLDPIGRCNRVFSLVAHCFVTWLLRFLPSIIGWLFPPVLPRPKRYDSDIHDVCGQVC